jgi:hypothetical protein
MFGHRVRSPGLSLVPLLVSAFLFSSCADDTPTRTGDPLLVPASAEDPGPPAGLATIPLAGGPQLTFWPYTGESFGPPFRDPVHLVLTGHADPLSIRAALLALDGDRSALGLPPAYPFDALWSDALGGVQTGYAEGAGWLGSVIQLELGGYEPVRFHLRLFGTGLSDGRGGTITLAAAHFEVLIPGTADHEVLSWLAARDLVVGDLLRTGLVDPTSVAPLGMVGPAPTFREIRAPIYNGLPPDLIPLIDGPPQPVMADVPIPSDGVVLGLRIAVAPVLPTGEIAEERTFVYDQVFERPFCSDGPHDVVRVQGPITFRLSGRVTPDAYAYDSHVQAQLTVTPLDLTVDPPVPGGDPFRARVGGNQVGWIDATGFLVQAQDRRLAPQPGGAEVLATRLRVGTDGANAFTVHTRCLEEE